MVALAVVGFELVLVVVDVAVAVAGLATTRAAMHQLLGPSYGVIAQSGHTHTFFLQSQPYFFFNTKAASCRVCAPITVS